MGLTLSGGTSSSLEEEDEEDGNEGLLDLHFLVQTTSVTGSSITSSGVCMSPSKRTFNMPLRFPGAGVAR